MPSKPLLSAGHDVTSSVRGPVALTISDYHRGAFFPDDVARQLAVVAPNLVGRPVSDFQSWIEQIQPEVLITGWSTPELPRELPASVKYICQLCGAVRHLVSRRQIEEGLLVTNWGNSISRTVAEMALTHILAALRELPRHVQGMRDGGYWRSDAMEGRSLFERRVGLHGFGNVAQCLVDLLRPFGVRVQVHAPDVNEENGRRLGVSPVSTLEELFAGNDIVVELAPLLPATTGVITDRLLRLLPPDGVFVNVGRGAVVDEAGLIRVAAEGRLRIGLDVFAEEPLPPNHPLRQMPNVLLTPHVAGPTFDRCRDAGLFAVANLRRYAASESLAAMVTPQAYDHLT